MIVTVYVAVATEFVTVIYNYWAVLGLDICLVILWLISFAITGSNSHEFDTYLDGLHLFDGFYYDINPITYRNILRVCAIFGAFEL